MTIRRKCPPLPATGNLAKGAGKVDIDLEPIVFAQGGLQPHNLLPLLRSRMEDISGSVDLAGSVTAQGKLGSDLETAASRERIGPVVLRNLNTVVEIDRPWPLSAKPDQVLSVELADVGLLPTNGLVRFKIDDGKKLSIAESRLEMIGGKVTMDPSFWPWGARPATEPPGSTTSRWPSCSSSSGSRDRRAKLDLRHCAGHPVPAGSPSPDQVGSGGSGVEIRSQIQAPLALKSAGESVSYGNCWHCRISITPTGAGPRPITRR